MKTTLVLMMLMTSIAQADDWAGTPKPAPEWLEAPKQVEPSLGIPEWFDPPAPAKAAVIVEPLKPDPLKERAAWSAVYYRFKFQHDRLMKNVPRDPFAPGRFSFYRDLIYQFRGAMFEIKRDLKPATLLPRSHPEVKRAYKCFQKQEGCEAVFQDGNTREYLGQLLDEDE